MQKKSNIHIDRFKKYMRRTYKNKLCAIGLFVCGLVGLYWGKDLTVFIFFTIMTGLPLFFCRSNCID